MWPIIRWQLIMLEGMFALYSKSGQINLSWILYLLTVTVEKLFKLPKLHLFHKQIRVNTYCQGFW